MQDDIGYVEIRERVKQHYERWSAPCQFEELQNICYFIAVLAHGTPNLAVQNFPPSNRRPCGKFCTMFRCITLRLFASYAWYATVC
jgi:hypothetical protein